LKEYEKIMDNPWSIPDLRPGRCCRAADAVPIAFDTDCDVSVTFVGSDAGYNNTFGWVSAVPPGGILNPLGTGHGTHLDSGFSIGPRAAHEDIYLYITTDEQMKRTYFSGPSSANPDALEHVKVAPEDAHLVLVGFEDLYRGGDRDFNDVTLAVACTPVVKSQPVAESRPVPEFPTLAFPIAFIAGMLGAMLFLQRNRET
jgi:hypothetical protein